VKKPRFESACECGVSALKQRWSMSLNKHFRCSGPPNCPMQGTNGFKLSQIFKMKWCHFCWF
jgi:hypothetical protein